MFLSRTIRSMYKEKSVTTRGGDPRCRARSLESSEIHGSLSVFVTFILGFNSCPSRDPAVARSLARALLRYKSRDPVILCSSNKNNFRIELGDESYMISQTWEFTKNDHTKPCVHWGNTVNCLAHFYIFYKEYNTRSRQQDLLYTQERFRWLDDDESSVLDYSPRAGDARRSERSAILEIARPVTQQRTESREKLTPIPCVCMYVCVCVHHLFCLFSYFCRRVDRELEKKTDRKTIPFVFCPIFLVFFFLTCPCDCVSVRGRGVCLSAFLLFLYTVRGHLDEVVQPIIIFLSRALYKKFTLFIIKKSFKNLLLFPSLLFPSSRSSDVS